MIFTCKMYVYIYAYVCMRQLLLYSRTALHRNVESDATKKVRDWLDLAVGGLKLFGGFNWGRPVTVNYLSKLTNEYHIKPDKPGRNQKILFYISIIFTMRRIDHKTGSCE